MVIIHAKMKISIVIPVYNEADHLDACLLAISRQTEAAYEVIVVDNNSTDGSASIARRYPFVKLLKEPKQGVVHARNLGFDTARGDIIGRIDADTLVPVNWTTMIRTILSDKTIDAVSGSVTYHELPNRETLSKIDLFFRIRLAKNMGSEVFLYGSNMAIRSSLWKKVRSTVCPARGMHEDLDIAIHAHDAGAHVVFDRRLVAEVSLRRFNTNFRDCWEYVWLSPRTYAQHGRVSQRHMYGLVCLVLAFHSVLKLAYKSYDPELEQSSLKTIFYATNPIRTNPATFVD
jgi:glycosyltransferase involved in cell wall biosynthesis